jgi:hypothetical protein
MVSIDIRRCKHLPTNRLEIEYLIGHIPIKTRSVVALIKTFSVRPVDRSYYLLFLSTILFSLSLQCSILTRVSVCPMHFLFSFFFIGFLSLLPKMSRFHYYYTVSLGHDI